MAAVRESAKDYLFSLGDDPGIDAATIAISNWLMDAQAYSASRDGGAASHFSLIDGWASSYPETTGYIIPTLISTFRRTGNAGLRECAHAMAKWLLSIQLADGSFQGGNIDAHPIRPTVFNTGQILLGLISAQREFGDEFRLSAMAAADWLLRIQDPDGAWRGYRSPFTSDGPKAYETHVAWALVEADRLFPNRG